MSEVSTQRNSNPLVAVEDSLNGVSLSHTLYVHELARQNGGVSSVRTYTHVAAVTWLVCSGTCGVVVESKERKDLAGSCLRRY